MYSISVYLYLKVSMCTIGEGHKICSVNLIGQLGKLKGPLSFKMIFNNKSLMIEQVEKCQRIHKKSNSNIN